MVHCCSSFSIQTHTQLIHYMSVFVHSHFSTLLSYCATQSIFFFSISAKFTRLLQREKWVAHRRKRVDRSERVHVQNDLFELTTNSRHDNVAATTIKNNKRAFFEWKSSTNNFFLHPRNSFFYVILQIIIIIEDCMHKYKKKSSIWSNFIIIIKFKNIQKKKSLATIVNTQPYSLQYALDGLLMKKNCVLVFSSIQVMLRNIAWILNVTVSRKFGTAFWMKLNIFFSLTHSFFVFLIIFEKYFLTKLWC